MAEQYEAIPDHIPVFRDSGVACDLAAYQVISFQVHQGASPTRRHYRAVLKGQKRFREHRSDDNHMLTSVTDELDTQAYIISLRLLTGEEAQ